MDPISFVLGYLAVFYILLRGPYLFAPEAAVAYERSLIYATPRRLRIVGVSILALYGIPLIAAVRHSSTVGGEAAFWLDVLGWLTVVSSLWLIVAPASAKWLMDWFWEGLSPPLLRATGAVSVAFGLFLAWAAYMLR